MRPPSTIGARNRRISSTSPASRNAPARCGPPSSRIEPIPSAPSWSSAERTRAGSFSPGGDDHVGAVGGERIGGGARGGAGDDDRERDLARVADQLARSSGRRASESNTTRRGWRIDRRRRSARSAADRRRARCRSRPRPRRTAPASGGRAGGSSSPEIHFESPPRVATLPSSVIADLNSTHGRPVRACLRNDWLSSRARTASSPSATTTSIPSSRRMPEATAGGVLARVVGGDDHARDPGLADRVGARRRAALVAARLERHVQGRAAQIAARRRRGSPRPRRAALRAPGESPRRGPPRGGRSRRRPAGSGSPGRALPRPARSRERDGGDRCRWARAWWVVCAGWPRFVNVRFGGGCRPPLVRYRVVPRGAPTLLLAGLLVSSSEPGSTHEAHHPDSLFQRGRAASR